MLLMPDHLHGIFDFPLDASMQALFANWKRFLSRKHGIHFQRDFFDHRLRSDESFVQKVEYIRYNPVRAGLVSEPQDGPTFIFTMTGCLPVRGEFAIAGHQVHIISQILPSAGDTFDPGLPAEFAFGSNFSGYAGDF
jgi:hypothetical protein